MLDWRADAPSADDSPTLPQRGTFSVGGSDLLTLMMATQIGDARSRPHPLLWGKARETAKNDPLLQPQFHPL